MSEVQLCAIFRFRLAGEGEEESVFRLYRAAAAQENCFWDDDYPDMSFIEEDMQENGLFVLEEKGALIAAVSLIAHDDLDELDFWQGEKSCVLVRLCVSPERQGQGLGKRLVRLCLEEAKKRGCDSLRLLADVRSAAANRLYEACGFERRGRASLYGHDYHAYEYLFKTA